MSSVFDVQIRDSFDQPEPPKTKPEKKEQPKREPKPTDDELADALLEQLGENYAFWRDAWWQYESGVWVEMTNISRVARDVLIDHKRRGIRPTKALCQSIEWFASLEVEVDEALPDGEPHYLNMANGLLNLNTHQLEDHRRDAYSTRQLDFDYDENANWTAWKSFLESSCVDESGKTDRSLIALLQEAAGYTLTEDTSHRVSFWLVGETGSGKSTFINALASVIKPFHATINLNELANNRFLLASLPGKRMVSYAEADAFSKLADGLYKTLVSDDEIQADVKHKDPVYFRPVCKVWWGMNNLPFIADRSGAVYGRVMIIPFNNPVPRSGWDMQLGRKLDGERAGILNWSLAGLRRLRKQGHFTRCEQIERTVAEYQQTNDIYATFLQDDQWVRTDTGRTAPLALFKAFSAWAEERGVKQHASFRTIGNEWKRLGLKAGRDSARYYEPVQLVGYGSVFNK